MSQELLYTSAPKGLKSGTHGFCMVLCSEGMPSPLATALEGLSAYKPVYPVGDPAADKNPVTAMHVILPAIGKKLHVLSRVASYGLDYSGRPNKLAHHVVLDVRDLAPAGPAWMLLQSSVMKKEWSGEPKVVPANRRLATGDAQPGPCQAWARVTGDAGWAGVLAESLMKDPTRLAYLIIEPKLDVLPLFAEAIALLPPDRRWQATFSTYFTTLPAGATCNWRCLVADSPLVHQSKRHVQALRLDLTGRLGKAPDGEWVEYARTGSRPRIVAVPRPTAVVASVASSLDDLDDVYDLGTVPTAPAGPPRMRRGDGSRRSLLPTVSAIVALTGALAVGIWASLHFRGSEPSVAKENNETVTIDDSANEAKHKIETENTALVPVEQPEEKRQLTDGRSSTPGSTEPSAGIPEQAGPSKVEKAQTSPVDAGDSTQTKSIRQQYFVATLPKQQGLEPRPLTATYELHAFGAESSKLELFALDSAAQRLALISEEPDRRRLTIGYVASATQDPVQFATIDVAQRDGFIDRLKLTVQADYVNRVSALEGCAVRILNSPTDEVVILFTMPGTDTSGLATTTQINKLSETVRSPDRWQFQAAGRRVLRIGLPFSKSAASFGSEDLVVKQLRLEVGERFLEYLHAKKPFDHAKQSRAQASLGRRTFATIDYQGFLKDCETLASMPSIDDGALSLTSLTPQILVELGPAEITFTVDSERLTKTFIERASSDLKSLVPDQSAAANGSLVLSASGREAASKKLASLREQLTSMRLPGSGASPPKIRAVEQALFTGERLLKDGALVEELLDQFQNAEIVAIQIELQLKSMREDSALLQIPLVSRVPPPEMPETMK